jgi:photosystem II stability/assembly factor-like uncharacterized protein
VENCLLDKEERLPKRSIVGGIGGNILASGKHEAQAKEDSPSVSGKYHYVL